MLVIPVHWTIPFHLLLLSVFHPTNVAIQETETTVSCEPGYYCPQSSPVPIPCPSGTYGPFAGARSPESCIICPPQYFSPWPGVTTCQPCGPHAHQPLPGQNHCLCQGEGQSFQPSDRCCTCALGYTPKGEGGICIPSVYEICRGSRTRGQHGQCRREDEWRLYCAQQVCLSPEDTEGFDGILGLCVCRTPGGPKILVSQPHPPMWLDCSEDLKLLDGVTGQQVNLSRNVLDVLLKPWIPHVSLDCSQRVRFSRPVYVVQTTDMGFIGMVNAATAEIQRMLQELSQDTVKSPVQPDGTESSDEEEDESGVWSSTDTPKAISKGWRRRGILNPTACLLLGDVLLFSVTREHYPQYDRENLYNSNTDFDWGPFRHLAEEVSLKTALPSRLFSVVFHQPGVYVLSLSSNPDKRMFVKVMPSGGQCYEVGPFFPTLPHHVTRMGITRRHQLLLHPDWLVIWGLLAGAVIILGVCVALMGLFQEYGWPNRMPIPVQYRALQLQYSLDDYSSKGSSIRAVKKNHRSLHAVGSETMMQTALLSEEEFWDYEKQVDMETFNSNMFFEVLLRHSVSVTAQLGQLRGEVKLLYQAVERCVSGLHLHRQTPAEDLRSFQELRKRVHDEQERRKAVGMQLQQLLDSQLRVLQGESKAQEQVHISFMAHLREALRLLEHLQQDAPLWEQHFQHMADRMNALISQMTDLVLKESRRQGAWAVVGEATGGQLLCPSREVVLTKDELVAADGSVLALDAVAVDVATGLILPKPMSRMCLASGHVMLVPPNFFVHPQTGRLLPMAGNVAYDPASSILVVTVDRGVGDTPRYESPLIPFVPFPLSHHGEVNVPCQLKALRPGQHMALGGPMCDPETGILVPILAVSIHPVTRLVLPLGGTHICPLTGLLQPIQVGSPMKNPEGEGVVLVTGVSLSTITGQVVPVGGPLLGELFVEPLSGRVAQLKGWALQGGKLVPHAGGHQALLDAQALGTRMRVAEVLKTSIEAWKHSWCKNHQGEVREAVACMDEAWQSSQRCLLQLRCRLEILQDWAWGNAQHGGVQGSIRFPGTELWLPALPGLEYPDPGGSGLQVPVLGTQLDLSAGCVVPLAGTMEDADGRGLVPIRIGARTVDPVTGAVSPVVGAFYDPLQKTVVPVTVSCNPEGATTSDSGLVGILHMECCARTRFWTHQRQQEDDLLKGLDRALYHQLSTVSQMQDCQDDWQDRERQFRGAAETLSQEAQSEAHRRAMGQTQLHLLLPPHVLLVLTRGDQQLQEQQGWWLAELTAGLERVSVGTDRLQRELHTQAVLQSKISCLRTRELWDQLSSRQAELDVAFTMQHCVREQCQLRILTAQAVLSGCFWYKDFGLAQIRVPTQTHVVGPVLQPRVLPLLHRLLCLLEEQKQGSPPSPEASGQCLTEGVQSTLKPLTLEPCAKKLLSREHQTEALPTEDPDKGSSLNKWLEELPVLQHLRQLEQQLRAIAREKGLLGNQGRGRPFLDLLDAQWECEGELVPLGLDCLSTQELLAFQHGVFLLHLLHAHAETPAVTLQLASSLPFNSYEHNAFRNSFFYQEADQILFVRRQRLRCVGGFALLLLHCVCHIAVGDMNTDGTEFQRIFFKALQFCLSDHFLSTIAMPKTPQTKGKHDTVDKQLFWEQSFQPALHTLLVNKIQRPVYRASSNLQHGQELCGLWNLEKHVRDQRHDVRRACYKSASLSPH